MKPLPRLGPTIGLGVALSLVGGASAVLLSTFVPDLFIGETYSYPRVILAKAVPWALGLALVGVGGRILEGKRAIVFGSLAALAWIVGTLPQLIPRVPLGEVLCFVIVGAWIGATGGLAQRDRHRAAGGAVAGVVGGSLAGYLVEAFGLGRIFYLSMPNIRAGALILGITGLVLWPCVVAGERFATRR